MATRRPTAPHPGSIPTSAGRLQVPGRRSGRVIYVGQGQEPAPPAQPATSRTWPTSHPRTRQMVTTAAVGRVDRGRHRGRGAAARVQLDQGVRPALQRAVPGRQELPVAGGDPERGVPAGPGDARAEEAAACATSGPTRTPGRSGRRSTCCCGSSRCGPAPPGSSSAPQQVGRPCLLGYIGKCSAPCVGRVIARGAPSDRRGLLRLHGRPHRRVPAPARTRDEAGRRRDGVRAGGPAARRHRGAAAGDGEATQSCWPTAPTPTWSPSPRTSSRPRCRSSTSAAAGCAASAAGSSTRSRTSTPPGWSSTFLLAALRRGARLRRCRARCWCPALPEPVEADRRVARRAPGQPGSTCGCRSAATSATLMETVERNAEQALALHKTKRASRPHHPQRRAAGDRRRARPGPAPRCGSSATTSRTSRARRGRLHGGLRGRTGPQERVPPLRDQVRSRARTTSAPCTR